MKPARDIAKAGLRILAGTALGGIVGALLGLGYLATERCAGPACAGLIVVPIMTGCAGLAVGFFASLGWILSRANKATTPP